MALATLYDETNALVYGLALRILQDQYAAEDVTIDVYAQVYRQVSSYDANRGTFGVARDLDPQPRHRSPASGGSKAGTRGAT